MGGCCSVSHSRKDITDKRKRKHEYEREDNLTLEEGEFLSTYKLEVALARNKMKKCSEIANRYYLRFGKYISLNKIYEYYTPTFNLFGEY